MNSSAVGNQAYLYYQSWAIISCKKKKKKSWCSNLPFNIQPVLMRSSVCSHPCCLASENTPRWFWGDFPSWELEQTSICSTGAQLKLVIAGESRRWLWHREGHSKVTQWLGFAEEPPDVLWNTDSCMCSMVCVWNKGWICPKSSRAKMWQLPPQQARRDQTAPLGRKTLNNYLSNKWKG